MLAELGGSKLWLRKKKSMQHTEVLLNTFIFLNLNINWEKTERFFKRKNI